MRPKRICSYFSDFLFFSRIFFNQLLKRGYDYYNLRKILNMVSKLDRESLIKHKEKEDFLNNNSIFFKFSFDFNFLNCEKIIVQSFNNIKSHYNFLEDINLKIINYMQPNLGRLLVHNYPLNKNHFKLFRYTKCFDLNCYICFFGNSNFFLKLNKNFFLPICINSNCQSKGIIYIIKCNLCINTFYIGQTERRVKDRINEHIRDIKKFKPFFNSKNVSFHFNLLGHNYKQHFTFFGFIKNCDDFSMRRMFEKQLIYMLNIKTCISICILLILLPNGF